MIVKNRLNIFQRALMSGFSCVPCEGKKPKVKYKKYKQIPATLDEAKAWTGNIAIICGSVSKGVKCLDFDPKEGACWDQWVADVQAINSTLLSKFYVENTPSGGKHCCYRSPNKIVSKDIACNKNKEAIIELKGEGSLFTCAPSAGYSIYFGKLSRLEVLSDDEESILLAVAESFNEYEREVYKPKHNVEVTGDTVFNRYDSAVDPVPLLQKHGWKVLYSRGEKVYLVRPEKKDGISATWNVIPNRFYCFSSSTKFEQEHPYKPSAVYAILEHGGNFKSACRAIAKMEGKY